MKMEYESKDEHSQVIFNTAAALTIKIMTVIETVLCVGFVFANQIMLAKCLEYLLFGQLILFLILRLVFQRIL